MIEIIFQIFKGIFVEPNVSVVALLLGFLVGSIWLYLRLLHDYIQTQRILLQELKKTNSEYREIKKKLDNVTQNQADIRVQNSEMLAKLNSEK